MSFLLSDSSVLGDVLQSANLPVPVLILDSVAVSAIYAHRGYKTVFEKGRGRGLVYDYAQLRFDYGGQLLALNDEPLFAAPTAPREQAFEKAAKALLVDVGLKPLLGFPVTPKQGALMGDALGLSEAAAWPDFMSNVIPGLIKAGWQVRHQPSFRHHVPNVSEWHAQLTPLQPGWFSLSMQIEVAGMRVDLAPILADLFRRKPNWLDTAARNKIQDETLVDLKLPDGSVVNAAAGRIKHLASMLFDLLDSQGGTGLAVSVWDAPRVVDALKGWRGNGESVAKAMAERLRLIDDSTQITSPTSLSQPLREYQVAGLRWLQCLREQNLPGILADEMGLGKTIQTLAHLLLEKQAGRLNQPALIVLPTSLIHNWCAEAQRFAPVLRVLVLHGSARQSLFEQISHCDMVLTTYSLLWRDIDTLAKQEFHMLVLDEAQTVKNAGSRTADAIRRIHARHRLCITGTPLENHMGELWALFDFLMPHFLGDSKTFNRLWRTPIEKRGDSARRKLLAQRIKPFILRRTKDQVVQDLPPKTVIVRRVELHGKQRDLYETVRIAMDDRIREQVACKGLARSRIVILDAMLKLRQVCCDPRLVRLDAARQVTESVKLTLLMQMLSDRVEAGRRILVFSQFTTMLGLIESALQAAQLSHVVLTGNTVDRETPVHRFQTGDVPIFLISLKAGGVGLNLTAADTVIHFDPWWNPAVENQATDRAHRIGQDKPVFVYKLIVEGSIEDKILTLQEKKADLIAGILSDADTASAKFSDEDIAALLAPLPTR
ncbi:DEAD/DEAH box helicase [Chitinivorax sp. B]|uniref:DEAD/DEAH box helicase n=1 Tax=Chitinivorax sp. B TaxID=2502235 RepID=UPI0010F4FE31|nr:DEAD/DEAH box helicase [Chitinivorax sp. B]